MTRILDFLRRRDVELAFGALIALLVIALVVTSRCNRGREAVAELARRDQAAPLEAAGAVVPKVADPEPEAARLLAENGSLRAEVERLKKVEKSLRVKLAASLISGPVVASGEPRPAAPTSSGSCPAPAPCLLAPGDTGEARAAALILEGDKGARVLVADLGCYRTAPGPETRLFGGVARAPLSSAVEEGPAASNAGRWGGGPLVGAGRGGWLAGGLLTTPEGRVPWLGWRVSALAGGMVGPGDGVAFAGAIVRP